MDTALSNTDQGWLARAAAVAQLSDARSRHGCVVVRGGSVLSVGFNRSRVHNMWVMWTDRQNCTTHAEAAALQRVVSAIGTTLYVVRINRRGEMVNSAPCAACSYIIESRGVKRVVHS